MNSQKLGGKRSVVSVPERSRHRSDLHHRSTTHPTPYTLPPTFMITRTGAEMNVVIHPEDWLAPGDDIRD
ncbi:MAG: hypothetical protein OXD37_10525 [Acidimicrobiaceae bacterium]|nr:hypothetical protein [Acidimicrobiaceae bacterium]